MLTFGDFFERFVQHPCSKTAKRAANGDRLAFSDSGVQRRHRAFGRPVAVLEAAANGPAVGDIARQRFATDINERQIRQRRLRVVTAHRPQQRRRRA